MLFGFFLLRREQQQRYTWNESKYIKPFVRKLSRPCVDLLDRMLQLDPAKRISVAGVQMHPWSTMPLPPKYQAAWDKLDAANKMVTERAELQLDKVRVWKIACDVLAQAGTFL